MCARMCVCVCVRARACVYVRGCSRVSFAQARCNDSSSRCRPGVSVNNDRRPTHWHTVTRTSVFWCRHIFWYRYPLPGVVLGCRLAGAHWHAATRTSVFWCRHAFWYRYPPISLPIVLGCRLAVIGAATTQRLPLSGIGIRRSDRCLHGWSRCSIIGRGRRDRPPIPWSRLRAFPGVCQGCRYPMQAAAVSYVM